MPGQDQIKENANNWYPTGSSIPITAENQFCQPIHVDQGKRGTLTLSGTFSATVTLQCRLNGTSAWIDVDTKTDAERYYFEGGNDDWRAGVKTGDFTSGTVELNLKG